MAKRIVYWSFEASYDLMDILNYYNNRNKSKVYSAKLYKDIQKILKNLDFTIAFPKKTSDNKLYYFTHNHIFVGFEIEANDIKVHLVIDERRSPDLIGRLIKTRI